jgi:hypothetical protein
MKNEQNNIRIAFTMLENSMQAKDVSSIETNARYIFSRFDLSSIARAIEMLPNEHSSVPVDISLVRPVIINSAEQMVGTLFSEKKSYYQLYSNAIR